MRRDTSEKLDASLGILLDSPRQGLLPLVFLVSSPGSPCLPLETPAPLLLPPVLPASPALN